MKLFNILLLWCSVLSTCVLADNNSLPHELMYFYYVYKFQWESKVEKTIAVGCAARNNGNMCYFDDFVEWLIEDSWPYNPPAADHTTTPGKNQVAAITQKIPSSARYNLNRLLPRFETRQPFPVVLEAVLNAANTALSVDDYEPSSADLTQAIESVQHAQEIRYEKYGGFEDSALQRDVGQAAYEYVVSDGKANYDWPKTMENIDDAVYDGKITEEQGERFKDAILNFSQNIEARIFIEPTDDPATTVFRRTVLEHLNNVRVMGTTIDQLNDHVVAESSSSGDSLRAPSHCGSDDIEFAFSDGSSSV